MSSKTGNVRLFQGCILGKEFSGHDSRGHRVMGLVESGALGTSVPVDHKFLWKIPTEWTLEQAATVPVCYATVSTIGATGTPN